MQWRLFYLVMGYGVLIGLGAAFLAGLAGARPSVGTFAAGGLLGLVLVGFVNYLVLKVTLRRFLVRFLEKFNPLIERAMPQPGSPFRSTELDDLEKLFSSLIEHLQEYMRATVELQTQDAEARYRRMFEQALDPIVTMDVEGRITDWNPQAEAVFGWSHEEVVGKLVSDTIVPERYRQAHIQGLERFRATGEGPVLNQRVEITALHRDGHEFPVDLAIAAVEGRGTTCFSAFVRDITERKRSQHELQQAKEAAEAANQAKSTFLANMSHELRTPLNAIIGYSEMLEEEATELAAPKLVPDLQKIHSAGKHLLSLINAVLDLSKIEAGKMDLYLESFSVGQLVRDVVAIIQPLAERNQNALRIECSDDVGLMRADLTKVRQVLFNLLSNACKFTHEGTISLAVAREHRDGADQLTFAVSDTGIGLTTDQMSRLFQEFSQADASTTRKFGGTGLGLALSQRFCRMMGGEITVTSEPGRGSTFRMRLPAEVVESSAGESMPSDGSATPTPGLAASTVLVIDDDVSTRELLARYLTREGFRVQSASDGEVGLRLARELRPCAITLDVMMPRKDGWAVLASLKADPQLADIPVVMLTMLDDKNLGYALGAAEYVTKPVDRERLVGLLRKYRTESANRSVLIVEDDAHMRRLLRTMLERDGWSVDEADNGAVGLEHLETGRPGVILLDLMMPVMDGFEFVAEVRKNEHWRSIPIVVITAKDLTAEDQLKLNGFVSKVLEKGAYKRDELLADIRDLVVVCSRQPAAAETDFQTARAAVSGGQ